MTKGELLGFLAPLPDNAEIIIEQPDAENACWLSDVTCDVPTKTSSIDAVNADVTNNVGRLLIL